MQPDAATRAAVILCALSSALGASGARADAIGPLDAIPSGMCPEGSRHSSHGGQCVVWECRPEERQGCAQIDLCVRETQVGISGGMLVAHSECGTPPNDRTLGACDPGWECRRMSVVPGRDPPVAQVTLGCCVAGLVGAGAFAFVIVRKRSSRARKSLQDPRPRE